MVCVERVGGYISVLCRQIDGHTHTYKCPSQVHPFGAHPPHERGERRLDVDTGHGGALKDGEPQALPEPDRLEGRHLSIPLQIRLRPQEQPAARAQRLRPGVRRRQRSQAFNGLECPAVRAVVDEDDRVRRGQVHGGAGREGGARAGQLHQLDGEPPLGRGGSPAAQRRPAGVPGDVVGGFGFGCGLNEMVDWIGGDWVFSLLSCCALLTP